MLSGPNGNHNLNGQHPFDISILDTGHQIQAKRHGEGNADSAGRIHIARCSVEPRMSWYIPIKRCADLLAAAMLLVILSPFIAVGVILVKLTSKGPAFYSQVRVGKNGDEFTLYKIRTMKNNAEAETGPVWSTARDARVTPIGKLLRSSHIDEFPQLWNVLRGQMSLVGPRPERPEFVAKLDWEVPYYRERLKVRPGITGLAQLRLPPDSTLDCVRRKVEHDVYYVRHVNPWLDLKLLIFTAFRLAKEINRSSWRCIVLPTTDDIGQGFQRAVGLGELDLGVAHFPVPAPVRSIPHSDPEMAEVLTAVQ